jgi:hypothetical protein
MFYKYLNNRQTFVKTLDHSRFVHPKSYNILQKHTNKNRSFLTEGLTERLTEIANNNVILAKGITLFTFFYCSLNFLQYKKVREQNEKKMTDKDDKYKK